MKILEKLRSKAIFPLLLLTWGLQAVLMYAALGLEIVGDKLEEWESPHPIEANPKKAKRAQGAPLVAEAVRTGSQQLG